MEQSKEARISAELTRVRAGLLEVAEAAGLSEGATFLDLLRRVKSLSIAVEQIATYVPRSASEVEDEAQTLKSIARRAMRLDQGAS